MRIVRPAAVWVLLACLLLPTGAAAWTGTPTGATAIVRYTEPTSTTIGGPVNLTGTTIHWRLGTGPETPLAVPASSASGGGAIVQDVVVPVLPGQIQTLSVQITASNTIGESARSPATSLVIDRAAELPVPNVVTGVSLGCLGTTCTLDWVPVSGATSYRVYRRAAGTVAAGLTGEYYQDAGTGEQFEVFVLSRNDALVAFDWGEGSPDPGIGADNFSVRWTGKLIPPVTGLYRLQTISDDGVRLYVDGQAVIDDWTNHGQVAFVTPALALTAGVPVDLRLEFYEHLGLASVSLWWEYPGQPMAPIPSTQLVPSVSWELEREVTAPPVTFTLAPGTWQYGVGVGGALPGGLGVWTSQ